MRPTTIHPRPRRGRAWLLAGVLFGVAPFAFAGDDGGAADAGGGGARGPLDKLYENLDRLGDFGRADPGVIVPAPTADARGAERGGLPGLPGLGGFGAATLIRDRLIEMFGTLPRIDGIPVPDLRSDGSLTLTIGNYGRIAWNTVDAVTKEPNGTVEMSARNLLLNLRREPFVAEIYAEGDVSFVADTPETQLRFQCDRITFLYPDFQGLATKARMRSSREEINVPVESFLDTHPAHRIGEREGGLRADDDETVSGRPREAYATADEIRIIDRGHAELINAVVTGDGFAVPHWGVYMPAALYRADEKIEAYHPTVRVGKVPVLWLPYLLRDLKYDWPWVRVSAGHSSRWGYYQRTGLAFKVPQREGRAFNIKTLRFEFDTFSERGMGLGAGMDYALNVLGQGVGSLSFYNIHENWISRKADLARGEDNNRFSYYKDLPGIRNGPWEPRLYRGDNRAIVLWEHRQRFNDKWDLRGEVRYYGDADVGLDYDRDDFLGRKDPTASLNIRRRSDLWQLEVVAQKRVNSWLTQTEYLPELRVSAPAIRVFDTPLYFDQDLRVGLVNRRFGKDAVKYEPNLYGWINDSGKYGLDPFPDPTYRLRDGHDYGYHLRALGESRISMPVKMGFATLTPWAGAKYGYFGETYGTPELDNTDPTNPLYTVREGDAETDTLLMAGATLSSTAYVAFGEQNRWRLTLQPEVAFTVTNDTRIDPVERYAVDLHDDYGREALLRYGFHAKLQRRDDAGLVRDVLDFGAAVKHYPRTMDRLARNYNREFTELDVDAVWRPMRRLTFWGSALYDTEYSRFNRFLVGGDWRFRETFRVYAQHARYAGRPEDPAPYDARIDETTFAVRSLLWNPHSRYSGEFAVTYNWGDDSEDTRHGLAEYRVALYRNLWDNFDLGFNYTVNYRRRDHDNKVDRGFHVTLTPMGFMGYKRPGVDGTASASALIAESRYANQPDPRSYAGNLPGYADPIDAGGDDRLVVPDWFRDDPRFRDGLGGHDNTPFLFAE